MVASAPGEGMSGAVFLAAFLWGPSLALVLAALGAAAARRAAPWLARHGVPVPSRRPVPRDGQPLRPDEEAALAVAERAWRMPAYQREGGR